MSFLRILLVDDNELVRRGIRHLLAARPEWQICGEAENGKEAIELVERLAPDIVVMDVRMPVLDGLGALAAIRESSPQTAVILMTMGDSEELMGGIVEAGARGFVSKADAPSELLHAIDSVSRQQAYFTPAVFDAVLDDYHVRASAEPGGASRARGRQTLTEREREVVRHLAEGESTAEIAAILDVTAKTVEGHRTSAMHKVGARSVSELVHYAIRHRLIAPTES